MLNRKHYEHVFVREILYEKTNSLRIVQNVKTTSNFCFLYSERLIF